MVQARILCVSALVCVCVCVCVCVNARRCLKAWDDSNFTGQGRCRYNLSEALSEVEAALEGSEEVEDAFAERGRELVKLCADLRAAYEEYVGSPLDFD